METVLSLLFDNNHKEHKILYKLYTDKLIKEGNAQKLLNLKSYIDYIFLYIFDLELDLFLSYKKEVEEAKGTTNISISDIAWYKLQNDEFDANSDKKKAVYKRLYDLYNVYKHRSYIQQYGQHFEDSFYLYIISLYFYIASFIRFVRFSPIFLIKDFIYKKYDIGVSIPFEQKRYIENNNIDLEKAFLNIDTSAGGLYNIYPPERLLKYLP